MKQLVIALVALFAIGCGGDWGPQYVDPKLADAVAEFESRAGWPLTSSVVLASFARTDAGFFQPETMGLCVAREGKRPIIYISDSLEDEALTAVLWHEIGHCELGLPHAPPEDFTAFVDPNEGALLPVFVAPPSIMASDLTLVIYAFQSGYSEFYLCQLFTC